MNAIITIPDHTTALLAPERRRENAASLAALAITLANNSVLELDATTVSSARALVADAGFPRFVAALEHATKPTPRTKLKAHVAMLFAAFPNAGAKVDLAGFARLLIEDITDLAPSDEALDVAFRKLRTTSKWLPSIAEAVEAVKDAMAKQQSRLALLARLPTIVDSAERALVRRDDDQRREQARRGRGGRPVTTALSILLSLLALAVGLGIVAVLAVAVIVGIDAWRAVRASEPAHSTPGVIVPPMRAKPVRRRWVSLP